MAASKVRADYEQLAQIAQAFGQQAETAQKMLSALQSNMNTLQGGDWVGKGADKFYAEMNSAVLPAMKRLVAAMNQAATTTTKISRIMKQAENDAAALFRLNGEANTASSGMGAGAVSAFTQPGPGGGGGTSKGGAAKGATSKPAKRREAAQGLGDKLGEAIGGQQGEIIGMVVGALLGAIAEGPAGRMLAELDPTLYLAELAEKSPTLRAQLEQLEKNSWKIAMSSYGTASRTNFAPPRIFINLFRHLGAPLWRLVGTLAHEVGHAVNGDPFVKPTATMTRDEFVKANVEATLLSEGAAQLNVAIVRDEILQAGGPDIGIQGDGAAEYQKAYEQFKAGKINRGQAIEKMRDVIVKYGELSDLTGKSVRATYTEVYERYWDENVAPTRKKP